MIGALVLGSLGKVCAMVGLQCTKVAEDNPNMKSKMAMAGGSMFILAGNLSKVGTLAGGNGEGQETIAKWLFVACSFLLSLADPLRCHAKR